ncbi:MAG: hypothetical protein NZ930_01585 [Candidatus Bipolaricaulota bacterium]|nr:hypothetical protein [Candidatus Bipolaricaulota bacterium]MDW8031706.1 hypothetical protein [Candidatus Bipolaricaulota bacterium]
MEEFLRSPSGTFFLFIVSVGPFLLSGLGSLHWRLRWIVLGELLLSLIVGIAWVVGNLLAAWILGIVFLNSLVMVL